MSLALTADPMLVQNLLTYNKYGKYNPFYAITSLYVASMMPRPETIGQQR